MRTLSPKTVAKRAEEARRAAEYAAYVAKRDRETLAWKLAHCRGMSHDDALVMVKAAGEGTITIDPATVAEEIEQLISSCRLHEGCKDLVRHNGAPTYRSNPKAGYEIGEHLCEGCAKPLVCSSSTGEHSYYELSYEQARALGLYHPGRCYHISRCEHCGDTHAVDSSD
jgi:hypothetical protein